MHDRASSSLFDYFQLTDLVGSGASPYISLANYSLTGRRRQKIPVHGNHLLNVSSLSELAMKNKRLAGALLVLAVVIAIAAVCYPSLYPPHSAPTPANFRRLYIGLEQDEVFAILGPMTHSEFGRDTWQSDECKIVVFYGGPLGDTGDKRTSSGTLTTDDGKTLKLQPRTPGMLETVRGWLRL